MLRTSGQETEAERHPDTSRRWGESPALVADQPREAGEGRPLVFLQALGREAVADDGGDDLSQAVVPDMVRRARQRIARAGVAVTRFVDIGLGLLEVRRLEHEL